MVIDIKKSYFLLILTLKGVFITVVLLIWQHLKFIKVDFLINVKCNYYYFTCSLKLSKCFVSFLSPNLFFIFQFLISQSQRIIIKFQFF